MFIIELLKNFGNEFCREGLLNVIAFIIALMSALVLHELAHGIVAKWNGDDTAKLMGRLTLNPLSHFDVVGLLMMLLVGFGWAKPVPVNPNNFRNKTKGMVSVSLAGVLTNIILAFVFSLFWVVWARYISMPALANNLYYLDHFMLMLFNLIVSINISFALFNILPLYPLDGYRFLSCFVSQENSFMTFLRRYSLYILLFLLMWNYLPLIDVYSPLSLYMTYLGNGLIDAFLKLWGLIFV